MIRAKLSKETLRERPFEVWNTFVDFLFSTPSNQLTDQQIVAQIGLLYESEVQNGGHLQFFLNTPDSALHDYVLALSQLQASGHAANLQTGIDIWHKTPRTQPANAEEYVTRALNNEFGAIDQRFSSLEPTLNEYLESYLKENLNLFIELI